MGTSSVLSRAPAFPSRQILLPLIVLFGYAAFLVTGIDATRASTETALPPIVLYIYLSALLVLLQIVISKDRSLGRLLYVFVAGGFAIVYAGEAIFNAAGNFTKEPLTYVIINALLFVVFIWDAISRRVRAANMPTSGSARGRSPFSYGSFATDFAGLAILCFIASLLLDTLGPHSLLNLLGIHLDASYVTVDLNAAFGLNLPAPIAQLQGLDLGIGFAALAIALLLLVIVGALTLSNSDGLTGLLRGEERFGRALSRILGEALDRTWLSLRLVLTPLIWLIPAFSIAGFALNVAAYLQISAHVQNATILDLFNPVNTTSLNNWPNLGSVLLLGVIAVAAVILSVAIVEHDPSSILRTLHILRVAGRIAGLTLAFFLYSLAALNAGAVLFSGTHAEPFQVGAGGLLALLIGIALAVFGYIRERTAAAAAQRVPTTVR